MRVPQKKRPQIFLGHRNNPRIPCSANDSCSTAAFLLCFTKAMRLPRGAMDWRWLPCEALSSALLFCFSYYVLYQPVNGLRSSSHLKLIQKKAHSDYSSYRETAQCIFSIQSIQVRSGKIALSRIQATTLFASDNCQLNNRVRLHLYSVKYFFLCMQLFCKERREKCYKETVTF